MHQQPATQEYRPRTIHANNRVRLDILPAFPRVLVETEHGDADLHFTAPLLANVSSMYIFVFFTMYQKHIFIGHLLTPHERQRRLSKAYPNAFDLKPNLSVLAYFDGKEKEMSFFYTLYEIYLGRYSRGWNVDMAILDFNLVRLHKCLDNVLTMMNIESTVIPFSLDEWSVALEFYLQIDVDIFYMKTCSFRGADLYEDLPKHPDYYDKQYLFCENIPKANFGMLPCNREICLCCHPRDDLTHRQIQPAVHFSTNYIHRFVNKYEAILNCPAVSVRNILYHILFKIINRHVIRPILSIH
jgi:hypothetical protein